MRHCIGRAFRITDDPFGSPTIEAMPPSSLASAQCEPNDPHNKEYGGDKPQEMQGEPQSCEEQNS